MIKGMMLGKDSGSGLLNHACVMGRQRQFVATNQIIR